MRCAALGGQGRAAVKITEGQGLDATIERLVLDALDRDPTIGAVYSIGGGNVATIRAFEQRGRKISAVLHHDLRADANRAGRMIIQAHGGMSGVDMSMSTCSSR